MIPTNKNNRFPYAFHCWGFTALSIVDSKYIQNFLKKLNPKYLFPSRKHSSTKFILEKSTKIKTELKENLAKSISVCLTIEIWSYRQMRWFLGITGHFIHEWQMISIMIYCKRFKGKHSAENIQHEYEETVSIWYLWKTTCIICDNAAKMMKPLILHCTVLKISKIA